jgi:DNA polymerase-3 subunit delta'
VTTLQDIFGQDAAIDVITRAYEADRLPHGLIFAGPVGVGKATAARGLAALFLCENPKKNQPCGKCESCMLMQPTDEKKIAHPDFHYVYRQLIRLEKESSKARDLPKDVITGFVVQPAGLKATLNRGKFFLIEEAELMNPHAQNALLKTLEEPDGRTLIVLVTDQPHALLPTIRSRCQIIRFGPLDTKVVERELGKRKIDKATAAEAAQLAEGSLGVALKWLEDGVVAAARDLIKRLDAILKGKPAGDLADWFKKAADAYAEKQLERDKLSSKDQATREALAIYLKIASNYFRTQLAQVPDNPDVLESACVAIDAIARAENYLDSNVNVALTFQQLAGSLEREFARPLSPASR